MNNKDIVEKNKTIAKFLGFEYKTYQEVGNRFAGWRTSLSELNYDLAKNFGAISRVDYLWLCRNNNELKFHNSWEWIIESYGYCLNESFGLNDECKNKFNVLKERLLFNISNIEKENSYMVLCEIIELLKLNS